MKIANFDFRIWSKKENKFVNIDCSISFKFGERYNREDYVHFFGYIYEAGIRDRGYTWIAPLCYENDDLELELFTGLYDKNHRKIYEGDIVAHYAEGGGIEYYSKVVFNQEKGAFEFVCIEHPTTATFDELANSDIGVVGNIHENPESLEIVKWK